LISRSTIENIISSTRIEEVIGDFVSLKRRGVNLIGLCPFHNEKTPSFTVSPVKGIYKCFGCGKAGNSVNFLMEHEHFTYPEALRYLAAKYGLEIEEKEPTPEEIKEAGERESLFILNQFALQFFIHCLWETTEGKSIGLSYLKERGIREDTIRKFQLGYSPDHRYAFSDHALLHGYKQEYLLKSGLGLEREGRLVDRFHSRIIFPVHTASGRVIGFGGRTLSADKNQPKYVNSPESEIYNKSKTLYGIYFAKNGIASQNNCCLVEGYMDVIALFQSGIENTVASSGTSLTQDQIRMIQRYTSNITILYDGDPAGIKASFRGTDMILEQGLNVRVVLFPDGEDPDSYARKHHPDELNHFITREALNFILFKTRLGLEETQNDPIRKAALINDIVHSISLIPDIITRSLYIKECASVLSADEQVLMMSLNKILRNKYKKLQAKPEESAVLPYGGDQKTPHQIDLIQDSEEPQEREIIRLLLLYGNETVRVKKITADKEESEVSVSVADYMIYDILNDNIAFTNPLYQQIFGEFTNRIEADEIPDRSFFLSSPDETIARSTVDIIFTPYELSENWRKNNIPIETEEENLHEIIDHALLSFKAKKLDQMISAIQKELLAARGKDNETALVQQLKALKERSNLINKQGLGRVVIR
jgi:DNA primase